MTEYLSKHWHELDVVEEANAEDLQSSIGSIQQSARPSSTRLPSLSKSLEQPSSEGMAGELPVASATAGASGPKMLDSQELVHGEPLHYILPVAACSCIS